MKSRQLRLAAVQMESNNGRVSQNLARAGELVAQKTHQRADVVLLPELFSTGFEINEHAWDSAEPQGGPTETWLKETARTYRFHIGGSYLEYRGHDFFDTFTLAGPDGILGRVRKRHPCSLESYIFKGGDDAHVIETALGRIGVAICYDGSLREVWDRILAADPDLVLMPMSAPAPTKTLLYNERRIDASGGFLRWGHPMCRYFWYPLRHEQQVGTVGYSTPWRGSTASFRTPARPLSGVYAYRR